MMYGVYAAHRIESVIEDFSYKNPLKVYQNLNQYTRISAQNYVSNLPSQYYFDSSVWFVDKLYLLVHSHFGEIYWW